MVGAGVSDMGGRGGGLSGQTWSQGEMQFLAGGARGGPWCWPPLLLPGGCSSSWATQTGCTAPEPLQGMCHLLTEKRHVLNQNIQMGLNCITPCFDKAQAVAGLLVRSACCCCCGAYITHTHHTHTTHTQTHTHKIRRSDQLPNHCVWTQP